MSSIFEIGLIVWLLASWVTHVISCFVVGTWGFLVAGAICFPVAWVHGTWLWFQ